MEVKFNINIYIIILIAVLTIIISVFLLTVYINKRFLIKTEIKTNIKSEDENKSIITKKDMGYWIVFLIIIGILWSSSHIYGKEDFTQYVSFSGTVTSIVLGVVAIIYSFFQSFDNSNSKESLQVVSNNLRKSSDEIKEHTEKVSELDSDLKKLSESLESIVKDVQTVSDNMQDSIKSVEDRLKNVEDKIDETNSSIKRMDNKQFGKSNWTK